MYAYIYKYAQYIYVYIFIHTYTYMARSLSRVNLAKYLLQTVVSKKATNLIQKLL